MQTPNSTGRRAIALRIAAIYFLAAAAWIVLSDVVLLEIAPDLGSLAGASIAKGLLFCAVTSLVLYVSLKRLLRAPDNGEAHPASNIRPASAWKSGPVFVFAAVAVLVVALGFGMFALDARHERDDAHATLAAIGELKGRQIEQWLEQRRQVALAFAGSRRLKEQAAVAARGGAGAAASLAQRLEAIRSALQIDAILVLDSGGRVVVGAGDSKFLGISAATATAAQRLFASGEEVSHFLHRDGIDAGALVLIDFLVPLHSIDGGASFGGVLAFRENARADLFKMVERWPTASTSAESLLVRRDGDEVLFLNDLRFHKDAAFKLRRTLGDLSLPAANALSNGGHSPVDGIDYRGVPVVAASRAIAGTDWVMMAKIDSDEVLAPVRRSATIWLTAIWGIVLLGALGVAALWRERSRAVALREHADAVERSALGHHLDLMSRYANDIILLTDADGRIVQANERAI